MWVRQYSPRMWGCTGRRFVRLCRFDVFPTHVGVYRDIRSYERRGNRIPHACGGVPPISMSWGYPQVYSPRMWGCTDMMLNLLPHCQVFPTHVGVYRKWDGRGEKYASIPHACGGVPTEVNVPTPVATYSPRMWGCTGHTLVFIRRDLVFPTHVGVYRRSSFNIGSSQCIPHACGGVPRSGHSGTSGFRYSPRMWGCTAGSWVLGVGCCVFPTHVGVYR